MVLHINYYFDPFKNEVAQIIQKHTLPTDKIVVWGEVWGEPFVRAQRRGLTGGFNLEDSAWINDPAKLSRLKALGFTKLILINPSPFIVALTSVTGKNGEKMVNLTEHLPAIARHWPTVFSSPSVLIVEIP